MIASLPHNDQPIATPAEDRFGINPFARALATSICKLQSPQGAVIGLNGPWGSGKSSAVNLVRHHLGDAVEAEELVLIDFACWWFRGEDALALAFFRELYAGLAPSLGEKVKKALPKLAARLLRAGALVGKVAEAAGGGVAGSIAEKGMEWLAGLIEQDEPLEKLHAELSKALAEQKKRFLIVIDDIDRLSPDDALLIFRLVKSVGRLPNVMYMLVYDRALAEQIVSERYPSEGPHYLEKIVQAAFELPDPAPSDVQQHLLSQIESICGRLNQPDMVRFMNIFYEGVAPAMRTPRDVVRFTNSLGITWPAVAGEVDLADFLALEVFRLLHPAIYRTVRRNKEQLTGIGRSERRDRVEAANRANELFFASTPQQHQDRLRRVLMRLFPALEAVWGGVIYGDDFAKQWAMERRVCSPDHFDSFFRFTVGDDALARTELDEFIEHAADHEYVKRTLLHAVTVTRHSGGTKAAVLLDELTTHAERVDHEKVQSLVTTLFEILDDINVDADNGKALTMISNSLRLHWLLRKLTFERTSLEDRSAIFTQACTKASLGWLADFANSAWTDHYPREGRQPEPPEKCLTSEKDAAYLRELLLDRIKEAARDGTLASHRDLPFLLNLWADLGGDQGASVRAWTSSVFATDEGVKRLAKAFTFSSWTQSMGMAGLGDLVAKRTTQVHPKAMARLMDLDVYRARVKEVAATGNDSNVKEFLDAWERADRGEEG